MVKRRLIHLGVLLIMSLMAAAAVAAEDSNDEKRVFVPSVYYESTPCNVTVNAGQSIQAAINNARSGQIICVRAGTYHEHIQFQPAKSGITLMAYPGERPIIDGRGTLPTVTNSNRYRGLVHITANNVVVDGFEVRNSNIRGVAVAQPSGMNQPLENVVVKNMVVTGSKDSGININGSSTLKPRNILVENNVVHSNLLKNAGGSVGGTGLVFVQVENSIARGNRVYHNLGEGMSIDRWTVNVRFESNIVYDNAHANIYTVNNQNAVIQGNFVFCTDDRTYWIGQGAKSRPVEGIQVRDESFPGSATKPPPSSGQVIINNVVVGCGTNFGVSSQIPGGGLTNALVANNSFINARGQSGQNVSNVKLEGQASFKNSQFVNNLILQTVPGGMANMNTAKGTPDLSTFTMANNLYSSKPNDKKWPAQETGRIVADPRVVNPVTPVKGTMPNINNYAILGNSPAINAGVPVARVTVDFFGQNRIGALDIGAIEFRN